MGIYNWLIEKIKGKQITVNNTPDLLEKFSTEEDPLSGEVKRKIAIEVFDAMLDRNPQNARLWMFRLLGLVEMKDIPQMIKNLPKAKESLDNFIKYATTEEIKSTAECDEIKSILFIFSSLLISASDYKVAIEWCDKTLIINPKDVNIWKNKGIALEALSRFSEAKTAYENGLKYAPAEQVSLFRELISRVSSKIYSDN